MNSPACETLCAPGSRCTMAAQIVTISPKTIRPALCKAQVGEKALRVLRRVVSCVGNNPEGPATAPPTHGDVSLASRFSASAAFLKDKEHGHGRIIFSAFDTSPKPPFQPNG